MIVFVRKWILKLAYALCAPLPLRERIVLVSSHGSGLTGNLAAIRGELMRRGRGVAVVVLAASHRGGALGKAGSMVDAIRAEYYLATSTVFIVEDYFFPLFVAKPKTGTTVIQTWHASGAFKKIGYSVLGKSFGASESLVRQVRIHSNYDYILMGSKTAVPAYSEGFGQPEDRFVTELGIPRTDVFFDPEKVRTARAAVQERFGLPAGKRIILYAPTFRGTSRERASYHDELDLETMQTLCGGDWVLLLRLHPWVAREAAVSPGLAGFVFDASDHADINDLMMASDLLVTDYSSLIFEYSLLERPMVFFAPDHEAYEAERGFYFPYSDGVPGPVFTTSEQVANYIAAAEFDLATVEAFRTTSFEVADGHASERVVDRLVLPALRGMKPRLSR